MSEEAVHVVPSRTVADNLAKALGEGAGIAPLAAPCSWDLALDGAPLERWPELWTSRLSEPLPTDEDIRASEREALARSIRLLEGASGQIELWHAGTLHDVPGLRISLEALFGILDP